MRFLQPAVIAAALLAAGCDSESQAPPPQPEVKGVVIEPEETVIEMDAEAAGQLVENMPGLVVLDIRTPEEFANGHIAGALNIDYLGSGFRDELSKLDREQPVLVYCASGNRSGKSLDEFRSLKFRKVFHLNTGYRGWASQNLPVSRDPQ